MKSTSLLLALVGGLALVGCGDDTSETTGSGGAGGGGGAGSTGNTTATTGGLTTSSTSNSSASSGSPSSSSSGEGGSGTGGSGTGGDPGTGGNGTGGDAGTGGSGTGGDPGTGGAGGGGADFCSDIVVLADVDDVCELDDVATSADGTTPCADLEDTWPARFYRVEVEAGDCLYMRADNAGSSGADIFGGIIDPDGNDIFPDDEVDCTDGSFCPEGALTMASAGTAYIAVGAYAEEDVCLAGTDAPFQLAVSVNGVAVDLADAASCEGDLFVIIQ